MATLRKIAGVTRLDGNIAQATLRLYDAATGAFRAETTSDAGTGEYEFADSTGEVMGPGETFFVMADYGSGVRPLAHGPISPGEDELALWTPAAIATELWLDAADADTKTKAGNLITAWADKSGNNRHATSLVGGEPEESEGGVLFNAQKRMSGTLGAVGSSPFFICCVLRTLSYTATGYGAIFLADLPSSTDFFGKAGFRRYTRVDRQTLDGVKTEGGGFNAGNYSYPNAGIATHLLTLAYGTDFARLLKDAIGFPGDVVAALTQTGSLEYRMGLKGGTASLPSYHVMFEVVVAEGLDNYQKVEGYLAHKWGLQANLPGDHPYKDDPPYLT